jgi:lipopolysaccharide/colanic/teichoic acid biosynthesis glycosyltransferase
MKRLLDFAVSALALVLTSPLLAAALLAVWLQDRHSPFYIPARIGQNGVPFKMLKIRTMRVGADKTGVDSTSADDDRITPIGHLIRRAKLDEVIQLVNVLLGQMSLVGPRPNVEREVAIYTPEERTLLSVKPGITDPASIVFSDLAEILAGANDANLEYNQKVRPWKSRLALFYLTHASDWTDMRVLWLTAISVVSRRRALEGVSVLLRDMGAPDELVKLSLRNEVLAACPPPGATEIVYSRTPASQIR